MARNGKRVQPRFWLILIILMLSVFLFLDKKQCDMIDRQNAYLQELEHEKEELEVVIAALNRKLAFSKSEDYVERMARTHLNMIMPDEILYVESDTH